MKNMFFMVSWSQKRLRILKTTQHSNLNLYYLKVVIPTTVPRAEKMAFRPLEANIKDIIKPFEMGTYLDVLSKFSNAYCHTISWLIVHFSKMCSKNGIFSTFLTAKMSKKQRFSSTFLKNAQLITTSYDHMRWKTSKARPDKFPSQTVWWYLQYWLRRVGKTIFSALGSVVGITTFKCKNGGSY